MNKIKNVSKFFKIFFQILFVVFPIVLIIAWMQAPEQLIWLKGVVQISVIPHPYVSAILHSLSFVDRLFGLIVDLIPLSIELFILYCLIKLFHLYEAGEIFSINNVRYIRKIGYALFVSQLLAPIHTGLMGLVLTLNNPHGHRFASVSFDQGNVGIFIIALLMILISWIMAEGCKLREEQQLTI